MLCGLFVCVVVSGIFIYADAADLNPKEPMLEVQFVEKDFGLLTRSAAIDAFVLNLRYDGEADKAELYVEGYSGKTKTFKRMSVAGIGEVKDPPVQGFDL